MKTHPVLNKHHAMRTHGRVEV